MKSDCVFQLVSEISACHSLKIYSLVIDNIFLFVMKTVLLNLQTAA